MRELDEATLEWCEDGEDCRPTRWWESQLASGPLRLRDGRVTAQGTSQPLRLELEVEDDEIYHAKWKPAPPSLDESNNSPRREIAAYELQKLFLPPERYVVPPTVLRCVPADGVGRRLSGRPFRDTGCRIGVLSLWVQDVKELTEEALQAADENLRESSADLNVLTILTGHRDSTGLNFLFQPETGRAFSVDNGITFGAWEFNPIRLFTSAWSVVRVPELQRSTIERLREIDRRDLDRLLSVAQLEVRDGRWQGVRPTAALDPEHGVRIRKHVVQLGLTRSEIDGIAGRLADLLAEVDAGRIALR